MKLKLLIISTLLIFASCVKEKPFIAPSVGNDEEASLTIEVLNLSNSQLAVQSYVKERPVIAHRGTKDYAPQETAAAYRYARYVGADYLQIDLQITKDGHLVVYKGDYLQGQSNVNELFPGFEKAPINHFTLTELKTLDLGSWFENETYDRTGFEGLQILTFEEIINICEGKLPDGTIDPDDTGNRPGLYIRLYDPWLNPGIEEKLKSELIRLGWYADDLNNLKEIPVIAGKTDVANTKGRIILATMQDACLLKLEEVFEGKIPTAYWLWLSESHMPEEDVETYATTINFAIEHKAQFIAPNVSSADLLKPWQSNLIRRTGARIQAYTIDEKASMAQYTRNYLAASYGNIYELEYDLTDGFITNRPQYANFFYGKYYLPEENRITPAPPFYDTNAIRNVFAILGY